MGGKLKNHLEKNDAAFQLRSIFSFTITSVFAAGNSILNFLRNVVATEWDKLNHTALLLCYAY